MKKMILAVLILLLLALTFPSIPSIPKVSATTTEDLRRVTPALPEDANVRWKLLWSDDVRVDMLGADHNNGTSEWIDLKFWAPRFLEIEEFTFIIEGHNPYPKLPY